MGGGQLGEAMRSIGEEKAVTSERPRQCRMPVAVAVVEYTRSAQTLRSTTHRNFMPVFFFTAALVQMLNLAFIFSINRSSLFLCTLLSLPRYMQRTCRLLPSAKSALTAFTRL
jgi:hypothetical protein